MKRSPGLPVQQEGRSSAAIVMDGHGAVFLDFWGTVARARAGQLELLPGTASAFETLCKSAYRTVVVVDHEHSTDDARQAIMRQGLSALRDWLAVRGVCVDHICMPAGNALRGRAADLAQVVDFVGADAAESWFVGDTASEILAARETGMRSIMVESGSGDLDCRIPGTPDFTVPDIEQAARFIGTGFARLVANCDAVSAGIREGDVVLIGGLSRSGKTTFANVLKHALIARGLSACTLSIDRWLKDRDERMPGVLGRYDVQALQRILTTLYARTAAHRLDLPTYDKLEQRTAYAGESIAIQPTDVVIAEGTIALSLAPDNARTHRFSVELDELERRRRVIAEYRLRGKSETEAVAIYADRQEDETPHILRSAIGATRVSIAELSR